VGGGGGVFTTRRHAVASHYVTLACMWLVTLLQETCPGVHIHLKSCVRACVRDAFCSFDHAHAQPRVCYRLLPDLLEQQ
jgi:hypothetical protein